MKLMRKQRQFMTLMLIVVLLQPFLLISLAGIVFSADHNTDNSGSWLKGVLLVLLSFIINNFVEKNKSDNPSGSDSIKTENQMIGGSPLVGSSQEREVLGFHVNWLTPDASSFDSLKNNWHSINMLAPFWYTINPDGSIESRYGGYQYEVDSLAGNRNIKVLPLINNNQSNNMILVDPDTRKKAVNNIVDLVDKYDYAGVNIDFELIPPWTRNGYTSFIKDLSTQLRRRSKMITISVFPKIDVPLDLQGAYDYSALAPLVDRVVIMTYDNHWSTGPAGPIAPIKWVESNIKYALEYLPPQKILLGIANYGYDWTPDSAAGPASTLSAKEAMTVAQERNAEVKWSDEFKSPYYYYWDDKGQKHEVWFESTDSAAFKLDLVNKYNLKGIAIWRLGNETDNFWKIVQDKLGAGK